MQTLPEIRRLFLMLPAALLLLLALANPSLTLPRSVHNFVFVLDITGSMNVADTGADGTGMRRLDFGKQLVREALGRMTCGSTAGLAVFTEHRTFLLFAPVEICENHLVISTMLDAIDGRMAWAELSEVAKGLYSGIEAIGALAAMEADGGGETSLVFMTDGHEAPPVHPVLRPKFGGEPGTTAGMIAGIGGPEPMPIPYLDAEGQVAGYWAQDEVMQVDRHSAGRPSTGGAETMAGVDSSGLRDRLANGTEHLSSLRERYLQTLAAETGLDYFRATTPEAFADALLDSRYATRQPIATDVGWMPAAASLLCLSCLFGSAFFRTRSWRGSAACGRRDER